MCFALFLVLLTALFFLFATFHMAKHGLYIAKVRSCGISHITLHLLL